MNRLEAVKPMLWMNEQPWHELGVDRQCECENELARAIERDLRRELYQWRHMPLDCVVENWVDCPMAIHDSGFGIEEVSDKRYVNEGEICSRGFIPQVSRPEDVEKIKDPVVTHDVEETEARFAALNDAVGDIIPVKKRGAAGFWFAPWDELIRWWGVEQAMMDLIARPEMVHAVMNRLIEACLRRLDQYTQLGLLSPNTFNNRVGSGGYGYTDELAPANDDAPLQPKNLWGSSTAQIFSDVSPSMHEEFALRYEIRWMERFGLNYYGCCEPLHNKLEILAAVPSLRKISISPWANLDKAVERMRGKYVISYKPNPAIFAEESWDLARAENDLRQALDKMQGCAVEIILKDLSTVRNSPERLWQWSAMASGLAEENIQ